MNDVPHALIGCELFITKNNAMLFGKRKNCFGAGDWGLPGGHLLHNERLADGACREAKEELDANIRPGELTLVSIVDDVHQPGGKHYIHVSFVLKDPSWEPKLMEPERCEEWKYFPLDALPGNIFVPHKAIVENYLAGRLYVYEDNRGLSAIKGQQ